MFSGLYVSFNKKLLREIKAWQADSKFANGIIKLTLYSDEEFVPLTSVTCQPFLLFGGVYDLL